MAVVYASLNKGRIFLPKFLSKKYNSTSPISEKIDPFEKFNYLEILPSNTTSVVSNKIQLSKRNLEFILVNENQKVVIMSFPQSLEIYNPNTYKTLFLSYRRD